MSVYTLVQLGEVALFAAVFLYGLRTGHPSVAIVGAGLMIGKAVLNILAPEGGSLLRRSFAGYGLGAVFTLVGIVLIKAT
jgi:hypothetical protein